MDFNYPRRILVFEFLVKEKYEASGSESRAEFYCWFAAASDFTSYTIEPRKGSLQLCNWNRSKLSTSLQLLVS